MKTLFLAGFLCVTSCVHLRVEQSDLELRTCVICGNKHATRADVDEAGGAWCKSSARELQCWKHPYGTLGFTGDGYAIGLTGTTKYGLCCSYQCE